MKEVVTVGYARCVRLRGSWDLGDRRNRGIVGNGRSIGALLFLFIS